jgi:phage repressor protein C with HTH and peptisase S24 domain
MLTHARVWAAIDSLAERYGLSPSGLAKRAGLDPTSFNKSKRRSADGRLRWPSTESLLEHHLTSLSPWWKAVPPTGFP